MAMMKSITIILYTILITLSLTVSTPITPIIRVSNYSSELSVKYETFYRPEGFSAGHYYEAIQIIVQTTGTYDFQCVSNMDSYGYMYNGTFTRVTYEPRNFIARDNDMGGRNQFKLTARLQVGGIYTLIVTTYNSGATGPFSIIASGPNEISFIRMNIPRTTAVVMTTSTTYSPSFTTVTDSHIPITSSYSGELTLANNKYPETDIYYQSIKVIVHTTGMYDLSSRSYIDAYGCLYEGSFNPSSPFTNRLLCIDNYMGIHFNIRYILQANVFYTLIFTTHGPNTVGPFMVVGTGPDKVNFTPIQ